VGAEVEGAAGAKLHCQKFEAGSQLLVTSFLRAPQEAAVFSIPLPKMKGSWVL